MLKEIFIPNRKILHGGCGGGGGGSGGPAFGGHGGYAYEHEERHPFIGLSDEERARRREADRRRSLPPLSKKELLYLLKEVDGKPDKLNLAYRSLKNSNLEGVNLRGAILKDADITNTNLIKADLRGVNIS